MGQRCSGPAFCQTNCSDPEAEPIGFIGLDSVSALDWGQGLAAEPVGRVFEETLGQLSPLDQDLLCFAGSSSLAAVRWLLQLGASPEHALDANGTTTLHAACRSGSVPVVLELIEYTDLLDEVDVSGWTAMHIAAHMGRRYVVLSLLKAKASPTIRNSRGLMPADLCKDAGTLSALGRGRTQVTASGMEILRGSDNEEEAVFLSPSGEWDLSEAQGGSLSSRLRSNSDDIVGIPVECEPELFFVNPKPVFKQTSQFKKMLIGIAALLFDLRPTHGLAFVVISGLEESYTGAMKLLLKHGGVRKELAGSFLGEPLSVCPLIRFSFFDSLQLLNTGAISSLKCCFAAVGIPQDLRKLDRILSAIASVWWRKHKISSTAPTTMPRSNSASSSKSSSSPSSELTGLDLRQYLTSSEVFYQLLFSTVMLHRTFWGAGDAETCRSVSSQFKSLEFPLDVWLHLNRGFERRGSADVPEHVQSRIYADLMAECVPELLVSNAHRKDPWVPKWDSQGNATKTAGAQMEIRSAPSRPSKPTARLAASALASRASLEGWLSVHNDCNMLAPAAEGRSEWTSVSAQQDVSSNGSRQWASLCCFFLFLAARPPGDQCVPHVMIDVRGVQITNVDHKASECTLNGRLRNKVVNVDTHEVVRPEENEPVRSAKLLPDGRWEELKLQTIVLCFDSSEQLAVWVHHLTQKPCEGMVVGSAPVTDIVVPASPKERLSFGFWDPQRWRLPIGMK